MELVWRHWPSDEPSPLSNEIAGKIDKQCLDLKKGFNIDIFVFENDRVK